MKYLILIHGNQIAWDAFDDAAKRAFARGHFALTDALTESGELIVSEALADPELATRVPNAADDQVEVRPVLDFSGWEM